MRKTRTQATGTLRTMMSLMTDVAWETRVLRCLNVAWLLGCLLVFGRRHGWLLFFFFFFFFFFFSSFSFFFCCWCCVALVLFVCVLWLCVWF